jgi:hypothetical protein
MHRGREASSFQRLLPPVLIEKGPKVSLGIIDLRLHSFLNQTMNWRYVRDHGLIHDVIAWGVLDLEGRLERK